MSDESWWLAGLNVRGLSQGDVVANVVTVAPPHPLVTVGKRQTLPGKRYGYAEETPGEFTLQLRGTAQHVLVISRSCDIDKEESKKRILVAPIASAVGQSSKNFFESIMTLRRQALFPLPQVPTLGDMYADLRVIQPAHRNAIDAGTRVASMNLRALDLLRQHLYGFLLELSDDAKPPTK